MKNFPQKTITIYAPFNYFHSSELIKGADDHKTIKLKYIETSLFPADIYDAGGNLVVNRPKEYNPQLQFTSIGISYIIIKSKKK